MAVVAQIGNIRTGAAEGRRDKIEPHLRAEIQILHILIRDIRQGERNIGHVYALMIRYNAAVYNLADNIVIPDLFHFHGDQAIVDQNGCAFLYLFGETLERDRASFIGALNLIGSQYKSLPSFENDAAFVLKSADADLRTFCIQQGRYREYRVVF